MLNPAVRAALARHADAFREAQPFRHVVIDDFFEPAFAEALLQSFPGFDPKYALNEMGQVGGKAVREHVRELPEPYPQLDAWLQTPDFLGSVSTITGIPDLRYDPDYIGGGTHENVDGQSLDMHIDFNYHPANKTHRRLNLIVYLNPEWEADWGGCIELAEDPWNPHNRNKTSVLPLFNRAVIFETNERSWHGFPRITLPEGKKSISRRSFAIYLYTLDRPAEETAPAHATVYVPEPRPDHLVVGHTLTAEDVRELDRRFAGARGQLHFLYEREKDVSRQFEAYEYALAEARAAAKLDVLGYARQIGAPRGFWPDAWASRDAGLSLECVEPCKAAVARVWVPDALADGIALTVDIGGQRATHHPRPGRVSELPLPLRAKAGERVEIRFESDRDWQPSASGQSADTRALAFRLIDLRLQHG
jgi:hypothetical protein